MSTEVRSQDTEFFICSMASHKAGRDLSWAYFKENVKVFNERFSGSMLIRMVGSIAGDFANEEKAIEIENFFKVRI